MKPREKVVVKQQHEMVYEGKRYVTETSYNGLCNGCVFFVWGEADICPSIRGENNKCMGSKNPDGSRIWVEDVSGLM